MPKTANMHTCTAQEAALQADEQFRSVEASSSNAINTLEIKFYNKVDDKLLKFAVIIYKTMVNGYFVSIKKGIPMSFRVGIGKKVNRS